MYVLYIWLIDWMVLLCMVRTMDDGGGGGGGGGTVVCVCNWSLLSRVERTKYIRKISPVVDSVLVFLKTIVAHTPTNNNTRRNLQNSNFRVI